MATARQILAPLRRPDGLFAVTSARRVAFTPPEPRRDDDEQPAAVSAEAYVEKVVPIEQVGRQESPIGAKLQRAWRSLGQARELNAAVLADVLLVLRHTVADPEADTRGIAPLVLGAPPVPPRATATHPRAFKGTIYKPPKPRRPKAVDLRPHLCVPRNEQRLLARMAEHLDEALHRLQSEGELAEWPSGPEQYLKPNGQSWPRDAAARIGGLPAIFRRYLLWNLRGASWVTIAEWLGVYWALDLENIAPLRRCVARLIASVPQVSRPASETASDSIGRAAARARARPRPGAAKSHPCDDSAAHAAASWCELASRMPPSRRADFLELVIESGVYEREMAEGVAEDLIRVDELAGDSVYRHRMFYALRLVRSGVGLAYALDGMDLANEYYATYSFNELTTTADGAGRAVRSLMRQIAPAVAAAQDDSLALNLWRCCSRSPLFSELLNQPAWRLLRGSAAWRLARFFSNVAYDLGDEPQQLRTWQIVKRRFDSLVELMGSMDDAYVQKAFSLLEEFRRIGNSLPRCEDRLPGFEGVVRRLCAVPFATHGYAFESLALLACMADDEWHAIERAPVAAFRKLESATRRANDSALIAAGFRALTEHHPRMVAAGFAQFTVKLIRVARNLGSIPEAVHLTLFAVLAKQPVSTIDATTAAPDVLLDVVDALGTLGVEDPVPRRLREHVKGRRGLRPEQSARDVSFVRERWPGLQLDILNHLADKELERGMNPVTRDARVRHALRMAAHSNQHRRAVRRLIRAHLTGESGFVERHPANRRWLTRHPRIDPVLWTCGIRMHREVGELGTIDLGIETDPLEVLRMGTHFGTCMGIGGFNAELTAAVALDINKRVVYARDAAGRIVARQLLALSESERLVCFSVYPRGAKRALVRLFRDYDLEFARQLGVCIHDPERDGYFASSDGGIAKIISWDFWDDGAWDLRVDDSPLAAGSKPGPKRSGNRK